MDAKSQRREESLKFNIDQLNKSLAEGGDDLLFELCIDTHQHSQSMEAYVSQSDLGLIVEYQNFILPETSWSRAYLLQAKRLHPSPAGYDEKASFKSVDARQHAQLERFAEQFGQTRSATSYIARQRPTILPANVQLGQNGAYEGTRPAHAQFGHSTLRLRGGPDAL